MNPFQSLREYELFVYALPQQFPRIARSTLVVAHNAGDSMPRSTARLRSPLVIA
jgi:hypothetical protein